MVHTLADITSDGTKQPLSAIRVPAYWVQIQSKSTNNAAGARVGDKNISATQGATLPAGSYQFFPAVSNTYQYDLHELYQLAENSDVFSVTYCT